MKGIIALDIDGTITADHHALPGKVVDYFVQLSQEGWRLIFITGRTFAWGHAVLRFLPIEYFIAVQNGAIILHMPSRKIIAKKYLDRSIFPQMNAICEKEPSDFVIYAGVERNDQCYYRPKKFSPELLGYLEARTAALGEKWQAMDSFDHLEISEFPSVKCFGWEGSARRLAEAMETQLGLHVPLIRDPFDEMHYVVQATHIHINKGQALRDLIDHTQNRGSVIAAGDDNNDRSMLAAAHIKVVMETAPADMLKEADIVAPSARNFGIIKGLQEAIKRVS